MRPDTQLVVAGPLAFAFGLGGQGDGVGKTLRLADVGEGTRGPCTAVPCLASPQRPLCWRNVVAEPRKMPGFLASREEFNPGPETRLDCSELLCNTVLLKYKRNRESF